jgi:hypothetical protein
MDFEVLPNVFIIGAAKSGTTSLFEILAQHPGVFAAAKKEIRFFSNDDRFGNGIEWYQETHFAAGRGCPVRVEATPAYLTWSQKVAPRIKSAYGTHAPKFVAIFRDPVKRAYSHYWHRVRQGDEDPRRLSFAAAIHGEEQRIRENWQRLEYEGNGLFGYFRAGCYATRLAPFLDLFPRERFLFLLQEDLQRDFVLRMSQLLEFLGLDTGQQLSPVKSNESRVPRSRRVFRLLRDIRKSAVRNILRPMVPMGVRRWLRGGGIMKPFYYPPMEEGIRTELYALYTDEIRRLEAIMGRDLSHWKTGGAGP